MPRFGRGRFFDWRATLAEADADVGALAEAEADAAVAPVADADPHADADAVSSGASTEGAAGVAAPPVSALFDAVLGGGPTLGEVTAPSPQPK